MGYGDYSHEAHEAITRARVDLPRQQVFAQTRCHPLMDPQGVRLRESRDSAAHPDSLAIAFALDVTGSMGAIPELLARKKLPGFMQALTDFGVADPQVLFVAAGDATCDRAPLQVGQFESAAREMDQWLTWTFLESGGGGGTCESYELALYFLAHHTATDCWRKRGHRGYVFVTGDEDPYPFVSRAQVRGLIGDELDADVPLADVVQALAVAYEPFFLIPDVARRGRCERAWREVLGDRVVCMEDPVDTCDVAAGLVALSEGVVRDTDALAARLRDGGLAGPRVGAVVRALAPYAATLGRDGAPAPRVRSAAPPVGAGASGHRRRA